MGNSDTPALSKVRASRATNVHTAWLAVLGLVLTTYALSAWHAGYSIYGAVLLVYCSLPFSAAAYFSSRPLRPLANALGVVGGVLGGVVAYYLLLDTQVLETDPRPPPTASEARYIASLIALPFWWWSGVSVNAVLDVVMPQSATALPPRPLKLAWVFVLLVALNFILFGAMAGTENVLEMLGLVGGGVFAIVLALRAMRAESKEGSHRISTTRA